MGKISLLDCTLRDGGYINDWKFGHNSLISIYERLVDANVDIIEVGFIDERRPCDYNRSIFPNTNFVREIWSCVENRPPIVVGMIDYGTCEIKNIQQCSESFLDGIRIIFKKEKMYPAIEYCHLIKSLGYKVFVQLVSITAYDEADLMELIKLVNQLEPYAVSLVDTYGILNSDKLVYYYTILDENIAPTIQIGFHAHNNLQLAYANTVAFIDKKTDRDIIVDGTLGGMGKSAGNAPLELIGMYLNNRCNGNYLINSMLESIEESISNWGIKPPWGYSTSFYLSAYNECHPSYVEFLKDKDNLSISKLNEVLGEIKPKEKKLLYDKYVVEHLYEEYLSKKINDKEVFSKMKQIFAGRTVLIIGPGKNILLQKEKVEQYIMEKEPIKIAINYLPEDIPIDYVFITKSNRYEEMACSFKKKNPKVISTSNLECRNGKFEYVINREPLLEHKEKIKDNSFLMLLKIMRKISIRKIACAGLDGYSERESNYVVPNMEYEFVKSAARHLNHYIKEILKREYGDLNLEFITYSNYVVEEDINSAAF